MLRIKIVGGGKETENKDKNAKIKGKKDYKEMTFIFYNSYISININ